MQTKETDWLAYRERNLSEGYCAAHRNYKTVGQSGPQKRVGIGAPLRFQVIGNKYQFFQAVDDFSIFVTF